MSDTYQTGQTSCTGISIAICSLCSPDPNARSADAVHHFRLLEISEQHSTRAKWTVTFRRQALVFRRFSYGT
jgi:hypothetical protein